MKTEDKKNNTPLLTRRDFVEAGLKTVLVASTLPASLRFADASGAAGNRRVINIMNFIRAEEPREPMNLMEPVREQMKLIQQYQFPATWLLQYDALVSGPFVEFLKAEMPPNHEVGIWFEMNRKICDDAGIAWRGRPDWEWDYHVPVAYAIGYTPDERRKLADTAAATFKKVFGKDLKSVASWNLDAISVAHFSDKHGIDAFGNCRDQLATDGFTIWGAPIAAYYPNRLNAWSPAVDTRNQIATPIFRLLGQDPVYYYDNTIPYPDTIEPVWDTGRSETFIDRFYDMIRTAPTQAFGYAQLGQENSFGWNAMRKAYPMQMEKLAKLREKGGFVVETMGETGRRFKRTFQSTPTQAQVMLEDPFDKKSPAERTVWYQSRFHRVNLHFRGNEFYLRDLHVYDDQFPQPFLTDPVREHGIEQRLLAVLDGYHWKSDKVRAQGKFVLIGKDGQETSLTMAGLPTVTEKGATLRTDVPLGGGGKLTMTCHERDIEFRVTGVAAESQLALVLEWAPEKSALQNVSSDQLNYRFRDFDYAISIVNGSAARTTDGVSIATNGQMALRLQMVQRS